MATPDTVLSTAGLNPIKASRVLVTPTGGQQITLADALQVTPIALTASAIKSNALLSTLPANGVLLYAIFRETTGHAVSVGIGTTLGGADVLAAQGVPASGVLTVPITSFSLGWFSAIATQALFLTSASWNSASINVSLVYQVGP